MSITGSNGRRWAVIVLFALAMAWVEAAVAFYLRTMIGRIEPYQPEPMPNFGGLATAELVRELATLIMLATVGWLAGRTNQSRLGYTLLAFGVWDIFYYVFLKLLTGWPHSLLDWDILFLVPLPWWGPVLAPICIAGLMIMWGTLVTQFAQPTISIGSSWKVWALALSGVILALYVFMADALRVANQGTDALRQMLPTWFNWPLFCIALVLMAAPVVDAMRRIRARRLPLPSRAKPN